MLGVDRVSLQETTELIADLVEVGGRAELDQLARHEDLEKAARPRRQPGLSQRRVVADRSRHRVDFLDVVYCHRADPETPIEETVWAMHDIITSCKALYWCTSEWNADDIRAAWEVAERHHLHKPIVEQPQYNLLTRKKVEREYARLYDDIGLGTTIWSPLASGLLTGKYAAGIPDDSRGALDGYGWLAERITDPASQAKVERLRPIADELGCSMAQLSIAWCVTNPHVSTVITGASRVSQVLENFAAIDVVPLLTPEVLARIDTAVA